MWACLPEIAIFKRLLVHNHIAAVTLGVRGLRELPLAPSRRSGWPSIDLLTDHIPPSLSPIAITRVSYTLRREYRVARSRYSRLLFYSERPRGAGFRSVNPAERWRENPARALARAGFSQHLECGIHRSESSPEGSFELIPRPVAR